MDEMTTDELGDRLSATMADQRLSLRQACVLHGWGKEYQKVYYRLTRGGWTVTRTPSSKLERLAEIPS